MLLSCDLYSSRVPPSFILSHAGAAGAATLGIEYAETRAGYIWYIGISGPTGSTACGDSLPVIRLVDIAASGSAVQEVGASLLVTLLSVS